MSGEWVRRAVRVEPHRCAQPMRDLVVKVPKGGMMSPPGSEMVEHNLGEWPDGEIGDLWRCGQCGRLWQIAPADRHTFAIGRRVWRPASLWQRLRHRSSERPGIGPGVTEHQPSTERTTDG